jgi:Tfp pilus assembly protein PilF
MKPWIAVALSGAVLSSCPRPPPPLPRALESNELCALYISRNDLQTAEDQCDLGLQFSPDYADLWANKGVIAYTRGQDAKAKEFFIKALRLNQDHAQSYNNLGMLYAKQLMFETAADNFRSALRVNPDYLEARYNLALAYIGAKKPDKAKKELRILVQIKPELADAWGQLGVLALDEGDHQTAVEYLTKATQFDPKYLAAWLSLGNAYMEAGRPCEGKDAYTSCIEVEENNAQCRNNILLAEKKCALQGKALAPVEARKAGAVTPQTEYDAALEYKEKGLVNEEERAYKRCLKYDPKFVLCHFGLFELYRDRSDEKNATIACKNFIKFASEEEHSSRMSACLQYIRD